MEKDKIDLKKIPNNINKENNSLSDDESDDDKYNKSFFHIFNIHINDLWEYFINPSFAPTYFFENCKIINNNNLANPLNSNNILELKLEKKNVYIKIKIEKIIDTPNFKSFTQTSVEVPSDISHFSIDISLYMNTVTQTTGVNIKVNSLEPQKDNYIYDYIFKNHKNIFQNIDKFIEINFKEYEQSESISIDKNIDEVWNFLIQNNYSNLKILLGNNASVKATNIANEIEVEHYTKNNIIKMMVSKHRDFNEKTLLLQVVSSTRQIPKQNISIKIINIKNKSCLLFFSHKIKQFLSSNSINSYSLIKQKTLWLLKTTIENNVNT